MQKLCFKEVFFRSRSKDFCTISLVFHNYFLMSENKKKSNFYEFWPIKFFEILNLAFWALYDTVLIWNWTSFDFWDILWHENFVSMNCETSLFDPQHMRNIKYINPILRDYNFKETRLKPFWLIFSIFPQNQTKVLQSCKLQIVISQVWVDVF